MIIRLIAILMLVSAAYSQQSPFSKNDIASAEKLAGLSFTDAERDSLFKDLQDNLADYKKLRELHLSNDVMPALQFNPLPPGFKIPQGADHFEIQTPKHVKRPSNDADLAWMSIPELAELLRSGQLTSLELTQLSIERFKKYDSDLHCLITLLEKDAVQAAKNADREIASGNYRGLLHGIPFGVKDLLALKGYPTTWGAAPYKDQEIDHTATVIQKLQTAGAVLVAKLTMGALAWGDVWYGGKTRNPWNLEQGSSGSSAGPASAVAAGLVPFAIGTETWGSIVSPSTRCGDSGLRPTYGTVSRDGAMALSWSMDKIGPIARSAEDCAIVYSAIKGSDGRDVTVTDVPFNYDGNIDLKSLRFGYLKSAFDKDYRGKENDANTLKKLRELGANLIEIELPDLPVYSMAFILSAESAAAFDDLTLSNRDDLLVRQIRNAWPNVFRASRFIPAVEYIQANRLRSILIQQMDGLFDNIDVYVAPSFGGGNLLLTNLSGHPCVVLPNGFDEKGSPTSVSFTGKLYGDGTILEVAQVYQQATSFHKKHPQKFQK